MYMKEKQIVFTGTLSTFTRKEAEHLCLALGALPKGTVTESTDYLVTGQQPITLFADDTKSKTKKLLAAEAYQQQGKPILVMSEQEFIDMVSVVLRFKGFSI